MRLYGKIEAGFWQNPKVRPLSEPAKMLLLYLYSCPHGNSVGCFILPAGYIMADLGWSSERVSERVSELVSHGFIDRSESSGMTRIRGWWGHNTIENDNVAKAAVKTIKALPRDGVLRGLINELNELGNKFLDKYLDELPNEFANEYRNPNLTYPNLTEPNQSAPSAPEIDEFEVWYGVYPRKVGKAQARKAFLAARKKTDAMTLAAGLDRYRAEVAGKDQGFIAHPATWLNGERWLDEPGSNTAPAYPQDRGPAKTNGHAANGGSGVADSAQLAADIRKRRAEKIKDGDPKGGTNFTIPRPELQKMLSEGLLTMSDLEHAGLAA